MGMVQALSPTLVKSRNIISEVAWVNFSNAVFQVYFIKLQLWRKWVVLGEF